MVSSKLPQQHCAVCGKAFSTAHLVAAETVREEIAAEILKAVPDWAPGKFICRACLTEFRGRYVHALLASEKGELSSLETQVLRSLKEHELLATDVDSAFEQQWTYGERLADRIAAFGGSWAFLSWFAVFLLLWVGMNSLTLWIRPLDPYPFIFLNLILSCVAAIQAPVIMMSQNRQEAKDRVRSQHDYQINLKAELEIRHLHEKVDHLLSHQWDRLVEIQELQLQLLAELGARK
ncbi:DUF1003 domain-containing protein [Rhodanobacter ginsengisoli]|uniref:DUF1003 domain-containing protein n=1 Tax=Rhodanobacter ginsengisoli TaxID=418646 RepID=A0ABW0QHE3_9GAMM